MTSIWTTGGMRGHKKYAKKYELRGFNMGIHKKVFEKTGGYMFPNKGEDIEFSIRIKKEGFRIALIENAYVYHKRRTDFKQFYKQLYSFGATRINIYRIHKSGLKLIHFLPTIFNLLLGIFVFYCFL